MLSGGRKGNIMYSYPPWCAQGWLNMEPEFQGAEERVGWGGDLKGIYPNS